MATHCKTVTIGPSTRRYEMAARPEAPVMYEQLSCSIAHSTLGQLAWQTPASEHWRRHCHWMVTAVPLAGFDCPSTLAMHVNSTPAVHPRRTP
jgi:hypothetical protein